MHRNKCVFCRGNRWSDKCKVIGEPEARKKYLRKGNCCFQSHISRNCPKTTCNYCKGLRNPQLVLRKRVFWKSWETLLTKPTWTPTLVRHLFYYKRQKYSGNPQNNEIVKIWALFDSYYQKTFISGRVIKILKFTAELFTFEKATSELYSKPTRICWIKFCRYRPHWERQ